MKRSSAFKVVTVVGTRPEIIKLSCVIPELDRDFQHVLIHTGQNYDYELNQIFFEELGIRRPDYFLDAAGATPVQTVANVLARVDPIFASETPHALLVLGDTNSSLVALAAKRRKIPVFHMEAGNRCFDDRVPEEINRRIVDHISDINLPYTEHARQYLIAEGIRPETIIKTGSPMKQVLMVQKRRIGVSRILSKLSLKRNRFFVVSAHREENVDDRRRLSRLLKILNEVARHFRMPVIVSTHPRTQKRIDTLKGKPIDRLVRFLKPLAFADYVRLQMDAACVLSDSGTLTEEASILGFEAIMLRDAHERPEGMDEGVVAMCALDADRVLDAVAVAQERKQEGHRRLRIVPDYDAENVSLKVANAIRSYTDYVNRVVWRKH